MSTYDPAKLVSLWRKQQIDVPMSMGHTLQNLVEQKETQDSHERRLNGLDRRFNAHQEDVQRLRVDVDRLQKLVEQLLAKK